jgi:hypothetical protein
MKTFVLFILLLFAQYIHAQKNGYYITLSNDTVPAFIHLRNDVFGPYSLAGIQKQVRISADSNAKEIIFQPGEIKSFFVQSPKAYSFFSKPVDKGKLRFMQVVATFDSVALYSYTYQSGSKAFGMQEHIYYTVEKNENQYLFLLNNGNVKVKKALRTFFEDNKKMLALIEPLFRQPGFVHRDLLYLFKQYGSMNHKDTMGTK